MLTIANLETGDTYSRSLTLESQFGGRLVYLVANASVIAQFRPLVERGGSEAAEYGPEQLLTPQSSFIDKVSGARFRSAVAGSPGRIVASLSEPGDILPAAGTPFSGVLASSGSVGVTVTEVPVGAIVAWGGSADPPNFLICDGRAISRTTYSVLFDAIGIAYGGGDGSTTFNIPDLRGRAAVGLGTHASVNALNDSDGVAVGNRRPQHRHTPHVHVVQAFNGAGAGGRPTDDLRLNVGATFNTNAADGGSGVAADPLDGPAYLVVNYIIATGVA